MKKQKSLVVFVPLIALLVSGFTGECFAANTTAPDSQSPDSRYHFLLFWKLQDAATLQAKKSLDAFASQRDGQLIVSDIRVGDSASQDLVKKYGVSRAPMPLILAVAPNGAVTSAIMHPIDDKKLAEAIVELERVAADQPELGIFIDSLKTSERGIIR